MPEDIGALAGRRGQFVLKAISSGDFVEIEPPRGWCRTTGVTGVRRE
jgi:hypothetical protein